MVIQTCEQPDNKCTSLQKSNCIAFAPPEADEAQATWVHGEGHVSPAVRYSKPPAQPQADPT